MDVSENVQTVLVASEIKNVSPSLLYLPHNRAHVPECTGHHYLARVLEFLRYLYTLFPVPKSSCGFSMACLSRKSPFAKLPHLRGATFLISGTQRSSSTRARREARQTAGGAGAGAFQRARRSRARLTEAAPQGPKKSHRKPGREPSCTLQGPSGGERETKGGGEGGVRHGGAPVRNEEYGQRRRGKGVAWLMGDRNKESMAGAKHRELEWTPMWSLGIATTSSASPLS